MNELDIKHAKEAGSRARANGQCYAECPYNDPGYRGAWQQGWREAHNQLAQRSKAEEQALFNMTVRQAIAAIDHNCDGPMTPTVAISRAITLARAGEYASNGIYDPLTEALEQAMIDRGWLPEDRR